MVRQLLVIFLILTAASCASKTTRATAPLPPTRQEIWNARFSGDYIWGDGRSVTLSNGRWTDESENSGLSRPYAEIAYDYVALGDIDKDQVAEAVVVLNESGGGSGQFRHLVLFDRTDGKVTQRDSILIGDRVQVKSIHIEPSRLTAEIVDQGDMDGACCPGEIVRLTWPFTDGHFGEPTEVVLGKLYPAAMNGSVWKLKSWTAKSPIPQEANITITFEGGGFIGDDGCNQYRAPVEEGDRHGTFSVGLIATTRRACEKPLMQVERQFLERLAASNSMSFSPEHLNLGYKVKEDDGFMEFEQQLSK